MYALRRTHIALTTRRLRLRRLAGPDRGDNPVPSAIIIAGLAVIAVILVGWIYTMVGDFWDEAPDSLPGPPGGDD